MFKFEAGGNDLFAEGSQVVLISSADLLDESVEAQAFEDTGHLSGSFSGEVEAQGFVLKTADIVFASGDGFKEDLVIGIEEVEARE